jgi:hypothetical protein
MKPILVRRTDSVPSKAAEDHSLTPRSISALGRILAVVALVLLLGCDSTGPDVMDPGNGNGPEPDALTVRVVAAPGSGLDFSAVGWTGGVPSAELTLMEVRDHEPLITEIVQTGAEGSHRFTGLDPGVQWATAIRHLSASEEALLPAGAELPILVGGGKPEVEGETTFDLEVRSPEIGSLVISEIATMRPDISGAPEGGYQGSMYVELYNNSESIVHLDGMLLGHFYNWYRDMSHAHRHACSATEPMRVDPEGIWAANFFRFPGSGTDHPVAPGQVILIAVSAADHRDVHPDLLDLTHADFEFRPEDWVASPENPSVPNMMDAGPEPVLARHLQGSRNHFWFLAEPVDLESLPRMRDPGAGAAFQWDYVRIPRDRVLDATAIWWDRAADFPPTEGVPLCHRTVHPVFDAVPGGFFRHTQHTISVQRRAVLTRDGRTVLLDTNVSAIDFTRGERTPGWIPDPEAW